LSGSLEQAFFALTPERVLDAVEAIGRRSTGRAMALNSLENRVYDVELEDGAHVVAKFYRPGRWSREAILDEHAFLDELAAEEVPVVAPLALGEHARTLGELPGEQGGAILYAVFPKVRGRPPEEPDDEQLRRLGRLVARLHQVGARRSAAARPALDPETYGAASVRAILDGPWLPIDLAARWTQVATALVDACTRAFAAQAGGEAIRLHGDCHLGNLLWGGDGPFFVDFDDFLHGPPVQDLWLLAPGGDEEAVRARTRLVEGYESMRAFDRRTLALVEPLRAPIHAA
jgi:Ser/Thr protein kinase RdoA (MazF antagonist)